MEIETLLLYTVKASALLALFYLAYTIFLKRETFFTANRFYLIAGLVSAAVLPLIEYTKIIWIAPDPVAYATTGNIPIMAQVMEQQAPQEQHLVINWWYVTACIYATGLLFFGIKLVADILKIRSMLKGRDVIKQKPYKLVDTPDIKSPFSFFNYIVYNSKQHEPQELDSILSHEKVHSSQKHSVDMLAAQAFCILFWFNPLMWLYKKAISQNLEFIADAEASAIATDKKAYQKAMLRLSVQPQHISISNHFYQSLIKKRIVMLNKQRSSRRNTWKYTIMLPVLAAFMMAFQVKTIAQEKEQPVKSHKSSVDKIVAIIEKDTPDSEMAETKALFKQEFDVDFSYKTKRNSNNEITGIRIEIKKGENLNRVYEITGNKPIESFTIEAGEDDKGIFSLEFGKINKADNNTVLAVPVPAVPPGAVEAIAIAETIDDTEGQTSKPKVYTQSFTFNNDENNIVVNGNDKVLVAVNGVLQPKSGKFQIPPGERIESVSMLKARDAKKRYGKEVKEDVFEINTVKNNSTGRILMSNRNVLLPQDAAYAISADSFTFNDDENSFHFSMPDIIAFQEQFKDFENVDKERMQMILDKSKALSDKIRKNMGESEAESIRAEMEKMKVEMQLQRREMEKEREKMEQLRRKMEREREKAAKSKKA